MSVPFSPYCENNFTFLSPPCPHHPSNGQGLSIPHLVRGPYTLVTLLILPFQTTLIRASHTFALLVAWRVRFHRSITRSLGVQFPPLFAFGGSHCPPTDFCISLIRKTFSPPSPFLFVLFEKWPPSVSHVF